MTTTHMIRQNLPSVRHLLPYGRHPPLEHGPMRSVALAIFPNVQALDVAGPLDVFAEANGFVEAGYGYAITVFGADATPVPAANGTRMLADATFEQATSAFDIALVAGGPSLPFGPPDPRMSAW